jgi:hypothetical protein
LENRFNRAARISKKPRASALGCLLASCKTISQGLKPESFSSAFFGTAKQAAEKGISAREEARRGY